jgi:hypothetical protein
MQPVWHEQPGAVLGHAGLVPGHALGIGGQTAGWLRGALTGVLCVCCMCVRGRRWKGAAAGLCHKPVQAWSTACRPGPRSSQLGGVIHVAARGRRQDLQHSLLCPPARFCAICRGYSRPLRSGHASVTAGHQLGSSVAAAARCACPRPCRMGWLNQGQVGHKVGLVRGWECGLRGKLVTAADPLSACSAYPGRMAQFPDPSPIAFCPMQSPAPRRRRRHCRRRRHHRPHHLHLHRRRPHRLLVCLRACALRAPAPRTSKHAMCAWHSDGLELLWGTSILPK